MGLLSTSSTARFHLFLLYEDIKIFSRIKRSSPSGYDNPIDPHVKRQKILGSTTAVFIMRGLTWFRRADPTLPFVSSTPADVALRARYFVALWSLLWTAPHSGQVHSQAARSFVPCHRTPHDEQSWLEGKKLSTATICFPYHTALFSSCRRTHPSLHRR